MNALDIILMVILLLSGIFLAIAVLMQSSKSHQLSGTIAGGAETFLGKEKGTRVDKLLKRLTPIVGAVFVLVVLVMYFKQPDYTYSTAGTDLWKDISEFANIFKDTTTN